MLLLDLINGVPELLTSLIPSNRYIIFFNTSKKTNETMKKYNPHLNIRIKLNTNWYTKSIIDKKNNYILEQLEKMILNYNIVEFEITYSYTDSNIFNILLDTIADITISNGCYKSCYYISKNGQVLQELTFIKPES